jgi:hypothetical protein
MSNTEQEGHKTGGGTGTGITLGTGQNLSGGNTGVAGGHAGGVSSGTGAVTGWGEGAPNNRGTDPAYETGTHSGTGASSNPPMGHSATAAASVFGEKVMSAIPGTQAYQDKNSSLGTADLPEGTSTSA